MEQTEIVRWNTVHKGFALLLALAAAFSVSAQEQQDDRVWLLSAKTAQLLQIDGTDYRKVVGPARFLHNNTYLICDTALWNVNTNIIDAVGHVRIIQDQTTLSSSSLQYVSDENIAKFRGDLVQLQDKDGNTLRTRYLDYNTKDSVAVFQSGGAMRDKDGQIMESRYGIYDAKAHLFVFNDQVNMYMDTTFIKTSRMEYRSDLSTAYFGYGTDMWQDDNMLSADDGWYDRSRELFFFRRKVHLLTKDQEVWADSMYYYRALNDIDMLGNAELMDTTRNVYALAGKFHYRDSLSEIRMLDDPAIMSILDDEGQVDTLYIGADQFLMRTYKMCDIPEAWKKDAEKRLKDIGGDPINEYRRKAAEEAAKKAEEAAKNDPNRPPEPKAAPKAAAAPEPEKQGPPPVSPPDTTARPAPPDSLMRALPDSLKAPADSLQAPPEGILPAPADTAVTPPPDTTKINFLWGAKTVRMFRRNMQMACDSLAYSDLDSLARLYFDPVFYNEGNKQYSADSIYMAIKNRDIDKAHLLNNAFITIEEAPGAYDQIRSVEMVAYFDKDRNLTRFDALGGASSLFYLTEQNVLATVNKVESKMIYATFTKGEIDHIYYYDNPKNDGYPTVQLPQEEKTLKGFRWEPERRPKSPEDVTSLKPRKSERIDYLNHSHVKFDQTEIYFPGYVDKLYRDITVRDSLAVVREQQRKAAADSLERMTKETDALVDSLMNLSVPDSLAVSPKDSLAATALRDSLGTASPAVPADSLTVTSPSVQETPLSPKEQRALEKARREEERARIKAEKQAAREAKWAEEDRKYELRQAEKARKKLEKERKRKLKQLQRLERKAQKERKLLEKYLEKERKKEAARQEKERLKMLEELKKQSPPADGTQTDQET